MECLMCGKEVRRPKRGPTRKTCSARCRMALSRERAKNPVPRALRDSRRWVRAVGKRPVRVDGSPASSTDPATWATFADVQRGAGDGFGVMLGGGIGCYDLDHVTDEEARELIARIPEPIIFMERSMSGEGVHVFVEAPEGPGRRRGKVERYTRARFIRMTFNKFV